MKIAASNIKTRSGFTLLEVVIAIAIFALMGTILYGAFSLGHGAVEKARARFEGNQRLRSLGDLLGPYIRSSFPYRLSARDPAVFYVGGEESVVFVSAFSVGMGGRGMAKISVLWEADGGGGGILALEEEVPVRMDAESSGGGHKTKMVLRRGVRNFRIDYLDPQKQEETWVERWDGVERKGLPRAVRLSYEDGSREGVQWVFPIMMSVLSP